MCLCHASTLAHTTVHPGAPCIPDPLWRTRVKGAATRERKLDGLLVFAEQVAAEVAA